jgi:hypothetical protein
VPKWAIIILAVFAVIGVWYSAQLALVTISLGPSHTVDCSEYPVMNVPSPSSRLRAEVRNEICESKNRYETIVWLTDGIPTKLGGNTWTALIAPFTQGAGPGTYSPLQLQLTWLSETELQISFPKGTELRSSAGANYGVKVTYVERNAP